MVIIMLEKQMWMRYAPDMVTEWRQTMEEGRDVTRFRELCEEIAAISETGDCEKLALETAEQMHKAPMREDYPYSEPSDYTEIERSSSGCAAVNWRDVVNEEVLREKIAGAWIGRISGCLLGKPMECLRTPVIHTILLDTGNFPMNRYVDSREFPKELPEKVGMDGFANWQKCWVDTIGGKAPIDDDTNYTVMAMKLIDEYGVDFTPDDILEAWLYWMPMLSACTAERVAYRNAAQGLSAPETATRANPYREWIGAQIRGDFFGYLNPGDPKRAAEMAWRDASISHVKNGIYGEMFVSAMLAKAVVCDDITEIIMAGLSQVPVRSRLSHEVGRVLDWFASGVPEEEVFSRIHKSYDEFDQHNWCHTNSNAMIVAACLLYGGKDFSKTVGLAVQTGFDTDCNGATAGSVLGMVLGERRIPERWPAAFGWTLRTSIAGYHEVTVDELTEKTMLLIARGR